MVKKIKNILVPLDGSKNSIRGLDEAIYIARQTHATVTGVFAKYLFPVNALHPLGFLGKSFKEEARKILGAAKVRCAKKGVLFKQKILGGSDPGYDIIRYAHSKKNKFNLIVIGARGRGLAREFFFGSVSNYVVHKTKIPVLIVK